MVGLFFLNIFCHHCTKRILPFGGKYLNNLSNMNSVILKSMGDRRKRVLDLYKQCYRISKSWKGSAEDKKYIIDEAKRLFHQNKNIKNIDTIDIKIFEAESRIQLGEHYQNPYPRIYHSIQVSGDEVGKKLIIPAYMV